MPKKTVIIENEEFVVNYPSSSLVTCLQPSMLFKYLKQTVNRKRDSQQQYSRLNQKKEN